MLGTGGENIEPDVVFKERWKQKEARIRRESVVGHLRGWRLLPVIVKTCDDLRQEQCAAQLIAQMHQILLAGGCESWLRPYDISALTEDAGLIEAIPDTVSLDALKKKDKHYTTLCDFYERFFGVEGSVPLLTYLALDKSDTIRIPSHSYPYLHIITASPLIIFPLSYRITRLS